MEVSKNIKYKNSSKPLLHFHVDHIQSIVKSFKNAVIVMVSKLVHQQQTLVIITLPTTVASDCS